jgi:hypothetical protein
LGDKITFTGGNNREHYLRINGEKVSMEQGEVVNLRVVLKENN